MFELEEHNVLAIKEAILFSKEGDIGTAERIFKTVLNSNNHTPFVHWTFGYEYLRHCVLNKAIDCFNRAIDLDQRCVQAWGGLGRALTDMGLWSEAEAALRRRLELGESKNHYVFLSTALIGQSKYEEALSCCERALQLDGNQVDALLNQSNAYSFLGLHDKAVEACRRAISIDNSYDDVYICFGVVLARANKLEEASEALQRADLLP